jgi:hypothetical protein
MPKHLIQTEQAVGDVTGTISNLSVTKLNGKEINDTAIGDNKSLVYKSASDSFVFENVMPTTSGPNFNYQSYATTAGTTTSTVYVNAATITVAEAGSYLCIYSDYLTNSIAGADMQYAIRVDRQDGQGIVIIPESERWCDVNSQVAGYSFPIVTQAYITNLKVNDIVYGSVATFPSTGTLTANKRQMYIIKLNN